MLATYGVEINLSLFGSRTIHETWGTEKLFGDHHDFDKVIKFGPLKNVIIQVFICEKMF